MGACTSSRRAAAAKQQQLGKQPSKKKKKSKSKVYSASMDSITAEADRISGIPQRKTPYSRGGGGAVQMTAFGFRRRVNPPPTPMQVASPAQLPQAPSGGRSTGRCSPHFPPTPPPAIHNTPPVSNMTTQQTKPTSALPRPLASRFGFQLSPRCTAVLNNINAQLVTNTSVDPNCNPLSMDPEPTITSSESNDTITSSNTTLSSTKNVNAHNESAVSKLPKPKSKSDRPLSSRLPAPKSLFKSKNNAAQSSVSNNKPSIAKPVVAKPVIRPQNTKTAKTEANRMVALQNSDSSPGSAISSGCGTLSNTETSTLHEAVSEPPPHNSRQRTMDRPSTAPTAKPEDFDDEDEGEEKACIDENLSEKPIEAWVETDGRSSSSGSYSEGIEEQQIEFPDNLTDKSADSLFSSCSSASDEPPPASAQKKKKSSGSLSQLSDGSSEQRDFLIDDEIADQPGLTFMAEEGYGGEDADYMVDEEVPQHDDKFAPEDATYNADETNCEEVTYNGEETYGTDPTEEDKRENSNTLIQELTPSIQGNGEEGGQEARASPIRTLETTPTLARRHRRHSTSTGTLSPCESITSDDLMLDFEDSAVDSTPSRRHAKSAILEEMCSELGESQELIKEWTNMLGSVSSLIDQGSARPQLRSRASSGSDVQTTPHGRLSRNSPLRPPRSTSNSGVVMDSEEGCVRLDWNAYQSMVQDIVSLKTNLHRLKRVLQEAEVRNPFDSSLKQNGLYYNLAHSESLEKREDMEEGRDPSLHEENVDLRRQMVFLQQQLNEKDRTINLLQQQMSKYCAANSSGVALNKNQATASNVATQTERVRPLSTGAALSQSYPSEGGPLVRHTGSTEVARRRSAGSPVKPPGTRSLLPRKSLPVDSIKSSGLPRKIPTSTSSK